MEPTTRHDHDVVGEMAIEPKTIDEDELFDEDFSQNPFVGVDDAPPSRLSIWVRYASVEMK